MLMWILLLLLILVIFGFGFAMQILWWVAAVLLALWVVGFLMRGRGGSRSSGSRRRFSRSGR
ncbi:hydrophobic protein [Streptomyces spectabilis]|uniref:Hydrophobic protein n=1 Tax=Streptomyces spectabilis TaxID=68270 RepID=A0A516RIQ7_STRST|nr:hydrophobic protein [Streptomyces spectabilis]QDQ15547.1 hydrophobic protein [Streptomyces spectabilis]